MRSTVANTVTRSHYALFSKRAIAHYPSSSVVRSHLKSFRFTF
ncbi:MAG: hypothetical protein U7123_14280 [Potamolinea sp.]